MSLKPPESNPKDEPTPRADTSGIGRSQNPFNAPDKTDSDHSKSVPSHDDKKSSSLITVLIAVSANLIITIAKTVAAFMMGSASMIA
ncbi:MAG: hypothetical protein N2B59_03015 [Psychrobacter sp.]